MCQPIAKRIDVSQLDSFACRQLSNLGYGGAEAGGNNLRKRKKDHTDTGSVQVSGDDSTAELALLIAGQSDGREAEGAGGGGWGVGSLVASARERAVAYREDSMRRLRYCLEWVAYATALLRRHMHELRQMLAALQASARAAVGGYDGALTTEGAAQESTEGQRGLQAAARQLAAVRHEMVNTVRKAVGVVSQYAGSVLPGEARRQVRGMILGLPRRWTMVDPTTTVGGNSSSGAASSVGSDDQHTAPGSVAEAVTPANVEATARRTLAFATESFYMLDGVKSVFGGLQANAERWWSSGSGTSPAPQSAHMEPECAATAYRDPATHSQTGIQQPGSEGMRMRRPPRRMRPDTSSPSLTAHNDASSDALLDKRRSTASLVEIGEQMRRMDMQHNAGGSNDKIISLAAVDTIASKRSCTRETTPTHESPLAFSA
ncbi:transcriptional regulator opi1 [Coemansia guatemalensis]|uniref:Transcriptional regulator opi1 n=1 Tax=Coemansia guatemalensis TaxID=2761395 RepID=A0A9W8LW28_9FUNG|nr:transcriptional regulator opi1 [Coemansia guatemalensis]